MAPATNWLSFSLSPLEMLRSSESTQFLPFDSSSSVSPQYLIDNFYDYTHNNNNVWNNQNNNNNNNNNNPKSQMLFGEEENQGKTILTGFVDSDKFNENGVVFPGNQTVPKLEDFLGECSQTETQDSSLTQIYDQAVAGFQAFSTNSGSDVDDSATAATHQLAAHSVASAGGGRSLSLEVQTTTQTQNSPAEKAVAVVVSDSHCSKNSKISDTFGQRTSIYRGVTRHRWTGRYEAHLWDNSCRREGQARKGRQVYLGGYDKEDKAARAYDLAALKYWGLNATTNFPVSTYTKELEEMKHASKQEFIASLRRKSSGFSRGASIYRGVTRHHQQGRWQARIGRVAGNKDLYLGTFATEEEAAEAYDIAAIKFRGVNAVTNFEMSRYDVETISKSALPVGSAAKRLKLSLDSSSAEDKPSSLTSGGAIVNVNNDNNIDFSAVAPVSTVPCGIPFDAAFYHQNYYHYHHFPNYLSNPDAATAVAGSEFYIWPHQSY